MNRVLRPHQERAIASLRMAMASGKRRPMLQLPTGAGKTFIAANIINMARAKGNRVCFCVPAISLIDQSVQEFYREGITDVGVIQADHPMRDYSKPVQIASIQTLQSRGVPDFDLIIVDEAHKIFKVIAEWMESGKPFIGLSATPWAKGLGKLYDDLLIGATLRELIDAGYLSDYRVFAPAHPDLSAVKNTAGDYNQKQLGEVMNDSRLVADVVSTWKKRGQGRPTLCFAVDRAHAKALQQQFEGAGVGCGYIDAYTDTIERKIVEGQLKRGEISVVANVGCLTTGVDWDVRCIILARPTRSEMLFVQMIGRGLRTADGKEDCLILDHADNHARLGFAADIHHDNLDDGAKGERKKPEAKAPLPKECPKCSFLKEPKVHECPSCGFKPEKFSAIEYEDGELLEVKAAKPKATKDDKQIFYSGLLHIAQKRGRAKGWVSHTYRDRFGVWPKGLADIPTDPPRDVWAYVQSKDIRFAKRRAA